MSSKLTDARRSLVRAKESAEARLKQLDEERLDIRSSIKSLDAAIKAVAEATKKAEALKSNHEKASKVAAETKAALAQLQKAIEAAK